MKSQLKILLQAVASCCQPQSNLTSEVLTIPDSTEDHSETSEEPGSFLHILLSCPDYVRLIQLVDIFHIYEPLAEGSVIIGKSINCRVLTLLYHWKKRMNERNEGANERLRYFLFEMFV